MGLFDSLVGIPLIKAGFQAATGRHDKAKETCNQWLLENPITAASIYAKAYIKGEEKVREEVGRVQLENVNSAVNGVPVVGHVKGLVHNICGDHEGAKEAYTAASRTTSVIVGGIAGGLVGGPVGAVAAGIGSGGAYDLGHSAIVKENQGLIRAIEDVINDPTDGGNIFDLIIIPLSDGLTGYSAHRTVTKITSRWKEQVSNRRAFRRYGKARGRGRFYSKRHAPSSGKSSFARKSITGNVKTNNLQKSITSKRKSGNFQKPKTGNGPSRTPNSNPQVSKSVGNKPSGKLTKNIKKASNSVNFRGNLITLGPTTTGILNALGGPEVLYRKISDFLQNNQDQLVQGGKHCFKLIANWVANGQDGESSQVNENGENPSRNPDTSIYLEITTIKSCENCCDEEGDKLGLESKTCLKRWLQEELRNCVFDGPEDHQVTLRIDWCTKCQSPLLKVKPESEATEQDVGQRSLETPD